MDYDKWKQETPNEKSNDFEVCQFCLNDISPYNTNIFKEDGKTSILCNKCYNTHIKK